jgi:AI-2 transport protein TqsA
LADQGESDRPAPTLSASLRSASRWWMLFAALLLLVGAMRSAAVVVLPIVLGAVLAMLLAPLVRWLDRIMWRWAACLIALIVPIALVVGTALFWWYAGRQVMERAGSFSIERSVERVVEARSWIINKGAPEQLVPGVEGDEDSDEREGAGGQPGRRSAGDAPSGDPSSDPEPAGTPGAPAMLFERILAAAAGGLRTALHIGAAIGLALAFCFFALWEAPRWRRWVESWPSAARSAYTLSVVGQWSVLVQRYLLAKAVNGAVGGVATWLWLLALDVPLAFVWGGLTFLLNFIPGVGVLLSAIPPIVLALTELGLGQALLAAGGLIVIESLTGQVLEPLLQAGFLDLSPFLVVASVLFWGWMWGAAGAVLAPILTAATLIAVGQIHVRAGKAQPRAP